MTTHEQIISALMTDSYKIVMAYSFYCSDMHQDSIACELFFRKCPFGGQYAVFAGLGEAVSYLKNFRFTQGEVDYLREYFLFMSKKRKIIPSNADPKFFEYLLNLDCSQVKCRGMREGSICFANEPLLSIEGPQGIVQIVETALINLLSFPTLVATNATRMRTIAGSNANLMEFGMRRAQGPDGAFSATQYSYLGGFDGTSNVVAGYKLGIPVVGTVAHSYITSFSELQDCQEVILNGINIKQASLFYRQQLNLSTVDGELAAFINFASTMPQNFLVLVDTYDTISSGVPNFVCVALALQDAGFEPKGIRLDSGDLASLSKLTRETFKNLCDRLKRDASKWKIVASNDINEKALEQFNVSGHSIDSFGIGTNLVTCQKQPALGMVYKLVECKGKPTMKLSEEIEKTTLPSVKSVWRLWMKDTVVDVITTVGESITENDAIKAVSLKQSNQRYSLRPLKVEQLLVPVFEKGETVLENVFALESAKAFCRSQLDQLRTSIKRIKDPEEYLVLLSEQFYKQFRDQYESLLIYKVIE